MENNEADARTQEYAKRWWSRCGECLLGEECATWLETRDAGNAAPGEGRAPRERGSR
jgi:hypothetical protein